MAPEPLFTIIGTGISAYALIYVLGIIAAGVTALRLARERALPRQATGEAIVIAAMAALLAGRVISRIARFYDWAFPNPALLAIPAAIAALKLRFSSARAGASAADILSVAGAPAALCHGIHKFGCLMAGCCHGRPAWNLPWSITFTNPRATSIYIGIPLHPTQLYEAAGYLGLAALLLRLRHAPAWRDRLAWVYLTGAGLVRFVVEFYRGDPRPELGPLTLNQWVCLAWVIVGAALILRTAPRTARSQRALSATPPTPPERETSHAA